MSDIMATARRYEMKGLLYVKRIANTIYSLLFRKAI